jgi:hypothetical protein
MMDLREIWLEAEAFVRNHPVIALLMAAVAGTVVWLMHS